MQWIVIPNWDGDDGFQHYKDRDPIWIKNYRRLLNKDEYLELSFHQRGILHSLWLAYAASNRQLIDNTSTLNRQLGHRVMRRDLETLNHAGFIEFSASKPLAQIPKGKRKKKNGASTQEGKPESRPNAAAYSTPSDNGDPGNYVSLEQLQAYAAALDNRHTDA